jgi:hypothetical protein
VFNDFQMYPTQAFIVSSAVLLVSCSKQLVTSFPFVHLVTYLLVWHLIISLTGSCNLDIVLLIHYHARWQFHSVCQLCQHYSHTFFIARCSYERIFACTCISLIVWMDDILRYAGTLSTVPLSIMVTHCKVKAFALNETPSFMSFVHTTLSWT